MAVLKMRDSKFGAPEGVYIGKFLGIQVMDRSKTVIGKDGRPMEPGMSWEFEIVRDDRHGGQYVGQQVGRITSQVPTTKNSCGTLLRGLVGRMVNPDDEVDPDEYIGRLYEVVIGTSRDDPNKTQVIQISQAASTGTPPAGPSRSPAGPSSPSPTPRPPAPPRPTPAPPPPPAAAVQRYWIQRGEGDAELLPVNEIDAWLDEVKVPPATVAAIPEDQQGGWKTLAEFGFKDRVPF